MRFQVRLRASDGRVLSSELHLCTRCAREISALGADLTAVRDPRATKAGPRACEVCVRPPRPAPEEGRT